MLPIVTKCGKLWPDIMMVQMTTSEVIISIRLIILIEMIISAWFMHVDSQRTKIEMREIVTA